MGASPVHSQRRLIVAPAEPAAADKTCIALSFNGRTSDSDSLDRGSNPWGATKTHDLAIATRPPTLQAPRRALRQLILDISQSAIPAHASR